MRGTQAFPKSALEESKTTYPGRDWKSDDVDSTSRSEAVGQAFREGAQRGGEQPMYRLYSILDTLYYSQHLTSPDPLNMAAIRGVTVILIQKPG